MAKYKAILWMSICAFILYWIHYFIFEFSGFAKMQFNLAGTYVFFWICAALIIFIVHIVHKKSPDNTGYTFVGATLIQMGLSYIMLRPIIEMEGEKGSFGKMNFFAVFILFLAIETLITIRLLNNKQ